MSLNTPLNQIVVVGANLAGLRAVETLRGDGFDGSIVLINGEDELPYDRPPLSKKVLTGELLPEEVVYRDQKYYDDLRVDLRSGELASSLDLRRRIVAVGSEPIPFDGLIVATGAAARTIRECQDLEGVHVIRGIDDARAIRAAFGEKPRVVVIGAGFIGSEVAASARFAGLEVTIVEMLSTPLIGAVGEEMGKACARLHCDNGTDLRCGTTVTAIEGNGRVERVRLSDGSTINADLVVVGIGVTPNVEWLVDSGLIIANGLVCDATLNAGHPAVYAAGDLVWWPNPFFGTNMRCEHWTNAAEQGRMAARNLLAGRENSRPYGGSCYFWSDQYGVRLQFVGIQGEESKVIEGSPNDHKFITFYRSGDRIVGALGMNSPRLVTQAKMMIEKRVSWDEALAIACAPD